MNSSRASASSDDDDTRVHATNGRKHHDQQRGEEIGGGEAWQPLQSMSEQQVRDELERVREERDGFESQYRGLLAKLTQMRSTLGDRLRQDAEELDRREQQIDILTVKTEELQATVQTLKEELVSSHQENERLSKEVDTVRLTLATKDEALAAATTSMSQNHHNDAIIARLERERELQEMLERIKMDSEAWEAACLEERAKRQDLEIAIRDTQSEKNRAVDSEARMREKAEREEQSSRDLQAVLEEFQSTQENELQRALGDYQEKYDTLALSFEQHRQRAQQAESKLADYEQDAKQAQSLLAEVKEKNLFIGKLRHEAVILNEHLTEALRRLRNDQPESNVDKRLVTNLLLQFITTPRTDSKRFEMLSLIASVLGWNDSERQVAGLQNTGSKVGIGIGVETQADRSLKAKATKSSVAGDESFSNLFVEFLLSEAEAGKQAAVNDKERTSLSLAASTSTSTPTSPVPSRLIHSPTLNFKRDGTRPSSDRVGPGDDDTNSTVSSPSLKSGGGVGSYFGLSIGKR